jgi:hypothetical protein
LGGKAGTSEIVNSGLSTAIDSEMVQAFADDAGVPVAAINDMMKEGSAKAATRNKDMPKQATANAPVVSKDGGGPSTAIAKPPATKKAPKDSAIKKDPAIKRDLAIRKDLVIKKDPVIKLSPKDPDSKQLAKHNAAKLPAKELAKNPTANIGATSATGTFFLLL